MRYRNSYVLKLFRLETLTFSDVTLSDINVVWCYVLSQYLMLNMFSRLQLAHTWIWKPWKPSWPSICTATEIPIIYSFPGNSATSAPISTFMLLWAIYIFPGSVHIFPPAEKADPSWEYIIRSQTHECGNWDWGPDIPFLGIFVSNFRHFVFAVWSWPLHT